uniref:PDZ domain-containing protein n=1 Tax=Pavo cristatus TaxID=9049 RepID=A0A8C9EYB4_PAVCR
MNHLVGPSDGEVSEEPANGAVNESVEADLEHSEVEEEQRYATHYPRHTNSSQGGLSGQEEEGMLARSASTESGFHNHTDTAEGDVIATVEDSYDTERVQENEDESAYAVQYRPESEEYTENAEAEHGEAIHNRTLPNHLHFHSIEHEEAMNAAYSGYVYTHRLFHRGEDEQYAEPYADYGLQEHVYEEIGDTPDLDAREGIQLYEREREEADNYRKEALGARLHHYDERSDGESDSPEKEAEFAPYPRMDSYEQEEDIDQIVAEVKQSMSSQSLDKAAEDMPEAEQSLEHAHTLAGGGHESNGQLPPGSRVTSSSGETVQRYSKEKRDAISLAIKDIKEAIEEVKTRTIRSPYTPDEPKEPIWVMRQDISPTRDSDDQRPLDGDSPSPDSSSPRGAESSSRQHHQDVCSTADHSLVHAAHAFLLSFPSYTCAIPSLLSILQQTTTRLIYSFFPLCLPGCPTEFLTFLRRVILAFLTLFGDKLHFRICCKPALTNLSFPFQICSLMRGGIAERGGVRVGHRIIEINGQSVVATPHEKIVHILSNAVGEVRAVQLTNITYFIIVTSSRLLLLKSEQWKRE